MGFLPNFSDLIKNEIDTDLTLYFFIYLFCCLVSACFSSSIAEGKIRDRLPHTILGLLIPLIYPIFIKLSLSPPKTKKGTVVETAPEEDEHNLALTDLDQDYFKAIYLDKDGGHTGPYLIDMESNIVKAQKILEVHPDFIIIETTNSNGKLLRQRIPYSKMTTCTQIEKEINTPKAQTNTPLGSSAWTDGQDPEIRRAIMNAQKNFHQFRDEISLESRRITPLLDHAIIKTFFPSSDNSCKGESLYMDEIRIEGETIYGIVTSTVENTPYVKKGDEVSFTKDRIYDWFYVMEDQAYGGHTLKAVADQLSESELSQAQQQPPLIWFT